MKINVTLIRSAATRSGLEGRFLGLCDEAIAPEGYALLERRVAEGRYPPVQLVFASGLARCLEAARRIYPNQPSIVINDLRPFDYGDFEGLTYDEITADKRFARFASANRLLKIPGSEEDPYAFLIRCGQAFRQVAKEAGRKGVERVSIVAHQLVLKSILRRYCVPRSPYRNWEMDFCGGYACSYDLETTALRILEEI